MKTIIQITLVFALVGNLTIPQSLTKYSPCCYDEYGNLTFQCSAHDLPTSKSSTHLKQRHSCCDPIKITLRGSPAPQLNNVTPVMSTTDYQTLAVTPVEFGTIPDRDECAFSTATTGPPAITNILTRCCRLNI